MMNKLGFQEFCEQIKDAVNEQLPEGVHAELVETQKNNGVTLTGLSLKEEGNNFSPNLYLEGSYSDYSNNDVDIDMIVDRIVNDGIGALHNVPFNIEEVNNALSHEGAHGNIVEQLIDRNENKELLTNCPHEIISDDLALIFREKIGKDGSVVIKNEHLPMIGMDLTELKEEAAHNNISEFKFADMADWMPQLGELGFERGLMYVGGCVDMNGKLGSYGASCVASPEFMEQVREELGEDFVILPSSIHECLFVPYKEGMDPVELGNIICDVNSTQVSPQEQLGTKPFMYDYDHSKIITMEEGLERMQERTEEHDIQRSLAADIEIA